jgi:hypothetical protein
MSDSPFGQAGTTDPSGFGSSGFGFGNSASLTDWEKIWQGLKSKEGQNALAGMANKFAAGPSANDAGYLKINAGAAPFAQGGTNSLLSTLLQLHLAQQQQQQNPLPQTFRASLLG